MTLPEIIAPCPFCGNEAQENFATLSDYIVCSCGAAGPSALKAEDAVVRWNKRANPLPFREASENPVELESIFVVSRVTDWDSDNMRFIPTPDCVFRFDESPYPGSRDAFTEFDLGWIYEADILRIFRAWKEGKAA